MFDEEGAASWRYRFALCECGTVEVRKGDSLLCCLKLTEEEMESILSTLP